MATIGTEGSRAEDWPERIRRGAAGLKAVGNEAFDHLAKNKVQVRYATESL
jgi:hypothetical protein